MASSSTVTPSRELPCSASSPIAHPPYTISLGPNIVLWVHSAAGIQFGLVREQIEVDLGSYGVSVYFVTSNADAFAFAQVAGVHLKCVVQNWTRTDGNHGKNLIQQFQSFYVSTKRHIPILTLSHRMSERPEEAEMCRKLGESVFTENPKTRLGKHRLYKWIIDNTLGIEKTVVLIRHGEGEHNVNKDYTLKDPVLTEKGRAQATKMREADIPGKLDTQLVVVSPLRRTLQTALYAFGESYPKVKFYCNPLLQEIGECASDIGSERLLLKEWFGEEPYSFDELEDDWYEKKDIYLGKRVPERVSRFVSWLRQREERSIIVVSHYGILEMMVGRKFHICEFKIYWLLGNGTWVPAPDIAERQRY